MHYDIMIVYLVMTWFDVRHDREPVGRKDPGMLRWSNGADSCQKV